MYNSDEKVIHTYTVTLKGTLEADSPLVAAQVFNIMHEINGYELELDYEVHQFVDTDVPPKVYKVNTHDLTTERVWLSPDQVQAWREFHNLLS